MNEAHLMTGPKRNIPCDSIYEYRGARAIITYPCGHLYVTLNGKYIGTFTSKADAMAAIDKDKQT